MLALGGRYHHQVIIPEMSKAEVQIVVPEAVDDRPSRVRYVLRNTPLYDYSGEMVRAADYYDIDWRLLPTIAILESSGGTYSCDGNAWGYASCRVTFETLEEGLWYVARTLSMSPYPYRDFDNSLCIWVSGHGCFGEHALGYLSRGHSLWRDIE